MEKELSYVQLVGNLRDKVGIVVRALYEENDSMFKIAVREATEIFTSPEYQNFQQGYLKVIGRRSFKGEENGIDWVRNYQIVGSNLELLKKINQLVELTLLSREDIEQIFLKKEKNLRNDLFMTKTGLEVVLADCERVEQIPPEKIFN